MFEVAVLHPPCVRDPGGATATLTSILVAENSGPTRSACSNVLGLARRLLSALSYLQSEVLFAATVPGELAAETQQQVGTSPKDPPGE